MLVDESTPTHELGEKVHTSDGRAFRYVRVGSGAALVIGNVLQSPAEDTGDQNIAAVATAVGSMTVTTGTMTVTANQYAGGFMCVTVTPGLGEYYKIASHAAFSGAAATFTLEEPIRTALTSSTRLDFVPNIYNGVIQNPASASGTVVGVAVNDIAASNYGWIQVTGPCPVLTQASSGNASVGGLVVASNGTAGAVEIAASASTEAQAPVGIAMTGTSVGETNMFRLIID